jgi:hypothetical protein
VAAEATRQRFDRHSRIRDVLSLGERGRKLLYEHGFDSGDGFVDVLSQYQSLEAAARAGRLRDLGGLLRKLNSE